MTSVWLENDRFEHRTPLPVGERFDHVIVGAGITGLVTAILLARSGARVAVLEARHIGGGTTGSTTAKVSLLQGSRLSTLAEKHGVDTLRHYVDANRIGMDWLLDFCASASVSVDRESAITYATTDSGAETVRSEHRLAREAGLDAQMTTTSELPFATIAAVELADQAQLDPMPLLHALSAELRSLGGVVVEDARVVGVGWAGLRSTVSVRTNRGEITAGTVVLATGTPILDRGGFFGRLTAQRSYVGTFDVGDRAPSGMYLAADSPTVSLRYVRRPGASDEPERRVLMVGGFGHEVARGGSERSHVQELFAWTRGNYPDAVLENRWSAQDYSSIDELPYVGPLLPGESRIQVATGFAKWGMTNGVAAALAISEQLLGTGETWAATLRTWRPSELRALPTAAKTNAQVGLHMTRGWTRVVLSGESEPGEGEGVVFRRGLRPVGRCTVDGQTSTVSPICTHLYGILDWNDAEKSWDCSLHGSRFTATGRVIEGPATEALGQL
ncbi:FAD-dependent oxidoreductase [Williamsia phyllosphaerae]|uniref:FAD-dependent oxidoreductase n=1 Tax=Williamsia phyllosphaerae TaxID=885042 RepID=A0ABQ1UFW6_9NOCA|nr:FAD-dependent oxidoreductase [Williamsia phyllosphaerae]GGF16448.1 FAD-dependent oxidoreductase [Williamsia phyllosphaerae]